MEIGSIGRIRCTVKSAMQIRTTIVNRVDFHGRLANNLLVNRSDLVVMRRNE